MIGSGTSNSAIQAVTLADLLFAWIGEPQAARNVEVEDGIYVRVNPETREVVGIEVIDCAARFIRTRPRWTCGLPSACWSSIARPRSTRSTARIHLRSSHHHRNHEPAILRLLLDDDVQAVVAEEAVSDRRSDIDQTIRIARRGVAVDARLTDRGRARLLLFATLIPGNRG